MTPILAIAAKGVLVLALAAAATFLLRRAPASARHGVWAAAFGALLLLPVLEAVGPRWDVGVLPAEPPTERYVETMDVIVGGPVVVPQALSGVEEIVVGGQRLAPATPQTIRAIRSVGQAPQFVGAEIVPLRPTPRAPLPVWTWALGVWALGAIGVGLGWLAATLAAQRIVSTASIEADEEWGVLAERARRLLGFDEPVRLLRSDALDVPIAWGWGRPAVVLPVGADAWDDDRREAVLLHEIAHLMRRDAWTQAVAQAALSLHWMNPLAWWGYRRFLDAREQACDDAVLVGGARPTTYAAHLVGVARALRRDRLALAGAAPMARKTAPLESRIASILDAGRRRGRLGRPGLGATLLFAAFVVLPLGALQPVAQTADAPDQIAAAVSPVAPATPTVPAPPSAPRITAPSSAPSPPRAPASVASAVVHRDTTDCETERCTDIERAIRESHVELDRARAEIRRELRTLDDAGPDSDALRAEVLRATEAALAEIDLEEIGAIAGRAAQEAIEDLFAARDDIRESAEELREAEIEAEDARREARNARREAQRERRHDRREAQRERRNDEREAARERQLEAREAARERLHDLQEAERERREAQIEAQRERRHRIDEQRREQARRDQRAEPRPSFRPPEPPKPSPRPDVRPSIRIEVRPAPRPSSSFDWDAVDRARRDAIEEAHRVSVARFRTGSVRSDSSSC